MGRGGGGCPVGWQSDIRRGRSFVPEPAREDALEAQVDVDAFPSGEGRQICAETIRIRLGGGRASAPASVVQPLFLPDLPVFLRWRGVPTFGSDAFESLVDVVDRLIVDSTEWPELPSAYAQLTRVFDRVVVLTSLSATSCRQQLASLWPGIEKVERIRVTGTAAHGAAAAGWLRSRLERPVALEHKPPTRLSCRY